MRKLLAVLTTIALIVMSFTACAGNGGETFKLGMGTEVAYKSGTSGAASFEATVATVILDKEGKIVNCKIDCVAPKTEIKDGFIDDDAKTATFTSKYDLGDSYNMKNYGNSVAEWYEQADAFAKYCVGKTVHEVNSIKTSDKEDGKYTDLIANCTIDIKDFMKAVVKACNDEQAKEFTAKAEKLVLFADAKVDKSNDSEDNDGKVAYLANFVAAAVSADGKTTAVIIDAAQPEFIFNDAGTVTKVKFDDTKRVLKENYNMVEYGNAKSEWYVQAKALTDAMTGKTADEIKNMPVDDKGKSTDADLLANCTIAISGDISNVVKALTK